MAWFGSSPRPGSRLHRDLGVNPGTTLGNWVTQDREAPKGTDGQTTRGIAELKRLTQIIARAGILGLVRIMLLALLCLGSARSDCWTPTRCRRRCTRPTVAE